MLGHHPRTKLSRSPILPLQRTRQNGRQARTLGEADDTREGPMIIEVVPQEPQGLVKTDIEARFIAFPPPGVRALDVVGEGGLEGYGAVWEVEVAGWGTGGSELGLERLGLCGEGGPRPSEAVEEKDPRCAPRFKEGVPDGVEDGHGGVEKS